MLVLFMCFHFLRIKGSSVEGKDYGRNRLGKAVYVYPTMILTVICAFSSVKYDVKKVPRGAPARPIAKPPQSQY
uniref:Uncharacterized protein n=1 Tax=Cucumis sativus TaxID=3659 RepID=A0A0A0LMA1_CUCSA